MTDNTDRRGFERFSMEFVVEVASKGVEEKIFNEKAVLKNISGGGAKFITRNTQRYFLGQLLDLKIYMPGTDDVKGYMKGEATVVRIDPFDSSGIDEKNQGICIAVEFNAWLNFERIDMENNKENE